LYPLEKQFVFIHKPPVLIRFNEVESVEFQRYAGGQGSTRNFDLSVNLKASATMGQTQQEYVFSGIDRSDYAGLYSFLSTKNMRIKNLQEIEEVAVAPVYNEDEIYGGPDEDGLEESEDEDYDEKAAANDDAGSESVDSDDMDDDEMGSEIDDDLDSDLEDARKSQKKKKKKPKPEAKDDDEDDDEASPKKKRKKAKAKKDPNAPKRARSGWTFYTIAQRSQVAEENPDVGFGEVTKLLSENYKKLSETERAKWDAKAGEDKKRFEAEIEDYSAPEDDDDDEEDKSPKKKAKKDPNAPKKPLSSYMIFMKENRARIKEENPDADFGDIVSFSFYGRCCTNHKIIKTVYLSRCFSFLANFRPDWLQLNSKF
jgi:structure-specific recognition protein 1